MTKKDFDTLMATLTEHTKRFDSLDSRVDLLQKRVNAFETAPRRALPPVPNSYHSSIFSHSVSGSRLVRRGHF